MKRVITCINCPVGCRMTVLLSDNSGEFLSAEGNSCARGAVYARQECSSPERMITAVIPVCGSEIPLSVKTSRPVPKSMISDIMHQLSSLEVNCPVRTGQIIIQNVLDTGSDIVATRELT